MKKTTTTTTDHWGSLKICTNYKVQKKIKKGKGFQIKNCD